MKFQKSSFFGENFFIQFIGDPIECKPLGQSQISERMFEFHCWIHGTFHRGDKNGRIEGRLCVSNYVSFEKFKLYTRAHIDAHSSYGLLHKHP